MSLGTLTATVDAETRGFVQGMAQAAARMETFAREAKKLAREVAQVSLGMIAFAAAAVRMAAGADAGVNRAVTALKNELMTLAIQVAKVVLPAVEQLTHWLGMLADYFAGLSPETRKQIADWVLYALEIGGAALVLGKVATAAQAAMTVLEGLAGVIGAIGVGTLGVVLIVLIAIAAAVAVVHKAWRENWGGIQEKTASVINAISGYWNDFKTWLSNSFFDWFIDKWASIEKTIAHAMNFLKNPLNEANRAQENRVSDETVDSWAASAKGGAFSRQLELAYEKAKEVVTAGAEEWGLIFDEIGAKVRGILPSSSGSAVHYGGKPDDTHPTNAQRLGEMGEQGTMDEYYKHSKPEDFMRAKKLGEDDEQGHTTAATAQAYEAELAMRLSMNEQLGLVVDGLKAGAMQLVSHLGQLGEVINAAVQGFQQGGIWGAIIAVIVELLSKFKRFQELIDIGNGQVQEILTTLGPGLNALVDGLREFMGASGEITQVVMQILVPILKIIAKVFHVISPLIEAVATALSGLVPIFELLEGILGPILDAIGYVLKFVGATLLVGMLAMLGLWQAVLAIAYEISKAANWGKGDAGIKAMMDANEKKINDVGNQMKNMWDDHNTMANASANASEKIGKLGTTAEKVSEQLTNLPTAYKVTLAQFQATLAGTASSSAGGSSGSMSIPKLAGALKKHSERNSSRQSGNPTASTNTGGGHAHPGDNSDN